MMTTSAFEILGPVMVGPSSSHTAGALRIALVARELAPRPLRRVTFDLYNSFSRTYRGHGTDRALVAGMLGLAPDDVRVRDSFELARRRGLDFEFHEKGEDASLHPNTVVITMEGGATPERPHALQVRGESLGGGRVRLSSISGVPVEITGDYPTIFVAHDDAAGVLAELTGILSKVHVNIARMSNYRERRGGRAYTIFESDQGVSDGLIREIGQAEHVDFAAKIVIPGASAVAPDAALANGFDTGAELLEACRRAGTSSIGELMRFREIELSGREAADAGMLRVLEVMRQEATQPIEHPERSLGGLLGGQARHVWEGHGRLGGALMGETLTRATAYAMAVLERSATMGVIVASPTAGSAGVVPGALLAVGEALGSSDDDLLRSLWCASAIGAIIARNASVAGAEGGCQAEVGTAAAMAAAGIVELAAGAGLAGGDPGSATPAAGARADGPVPVAKLALSAASTAIANLLGLVCDPVRGLVEYPCQDRNAIGVADAISAAQLALSGVLDPLPFDEVVGAMKGVGESLPVTLRETALGGLAAAPSACTACSRCPL